MLKATWKPEYLKLIEKSKDSLELIEYLRKEEREQGKKPLIQFSTSLFEAGGCKRNKITEHDQLPRCSLLGVWDYGGGKMYKCIILNL